MQSTGHSGESGSVPTRVLCVGDVPGRLADELAEWDRVAVDSVATARETLDHLERTPASCVVTAASLPDANADSLLDGVRAVRSSVPFVVVAETPDADLAERLLARDATEYVHWRGRDYQSRQVVRRVENVMARRRVEDEMEREREFVEGALDALPDAFFTLDRAGRMVLWNEKVTEVTGFDDDELALQYPTVFFPDEYAGRIVEAIERVFERGEARVEAPVRAADGREIPYEFTGALLEDDDGELLGITGIGRDITERERREAELEASREQYQRLVETAPDAIFVVDAESGEIVDTNEAAERLLDKSREEIVGMHQLELHPSSEAERYRRVFERHVESGGTVRDDDEYYVVRDDGHRIPVEISAGITELGGRTLNQAVFRDVTDRKRREETLATLRGVTRDLMSAESKRRICQLAVETARDILDLSVSGIFLLDEDDRALRPVAVTTDAKELFDEIPTFEAEEGLAWRVLESGTPQLYDSVRSQDAVYNPETPVQTEMILPLGDHGVLMSGSTASERLTESTLDLAKILAANVEAALDRADRERTIERQRDRLQDELDEVFERIDDGFFALDEEWRVTYANERAGRLLDASGADADPTDSLGADVRDAFPQLEASGALDAFRRAVATQDPVSCEERVEAFDAWFEFHAYPSESGLSVYFRDVSARKRREEQLEQQNERLDSFASMVAHELRNPLSIAQIYLQSAEYGDETAFEEIETALDRIEDMIDVILVMTRGGDATIDPEPVSLRETAVEVWESVAAADARLDVETDRVVAAEPHHLRHLLENLFKNAHEHGREDVTVRVGELDSGFYVADDGPGVPEPHRERVFEAGYTTDDGGIGLGLTFVTQLAETYGWECRITESESGGARFEFRDVTVVE